MLAFRIMSVRGGHGHVGQCVLGRLPERFPGLQLVRIARDSDWYPDPSGQALVVDGDAESLDIIMVLRIANSVRGLLNFADGPQLLALADQNLIIMSVHEPELALEISGRHERRVMEESPRLGVLPFQDHLTIRPRWRSCLCKFFFKSLQHFRQTFG